MKKLIALIIFSLFTSMCYASSKLGTVGAQFLKMGAGARSTALGEAFVGIADDVNAVYYNPGGLGFISRPEFTAIRTQWFEDINYDFGAFVYPTDFGAFGLSASTLKVEDIQKRSLDESYQGNFESTDEAYALSFAKVMGPVTSIGLTGRYIKQELDTETSNAWSTDIGIIRKLTSYPITMGLAARHLGQKIKFKNESDPQPMVFDFGLSGNLFREKLLVAGNVKKPRDSGVEFGLGTEVRLPLKGQVQIMGRAGYNSSLTLGEDVNGITFGGGITIQRLSIDAAWIPLGVLGNSFRYSLRMKF